MKYCSTRGGDGVSLEAALLGGIAPDGGLFVPEPMPEFAESDFNSSATLAEIAEHYLRPFFADSVLLDELPGILAETFSFPIPVSMASWSPVDRYFARSHLARSNHAAA